MAGKVIEPLPERPRRFPVTQKAQPFRGRDLQLEERVEQLASG